MFLHIARCDGPGCREEAPLVVSVNTTTTAWTGGVSMPGTNYSKPNNWIELDGKTFHGYACLAAYADGRVRNGSR